MSDDCVLVKDRAEYEREKKEKRRETSVAPAFL
jgi:hypothetical protein